MSGAVQPNGRRLVVERRDGRSFRNRSDAANVLEFRHKSTCIQCKSEGGNRASAILSDFTEESAGADLSLDSRPVHGSSGYAAAFRYRLSLFVSVRGEIPSFEATTC